MMRGKETMRGMEMRGMEMSERDGDDERDGDGERDW